MVRMMRMVRMVRMVRVVRMVRMVRVVRMVSIVLGIPQKKEIDRRVGRVCRRDSPTRLSASE